jgi:hypothetical protein
MPSLCELKHREPAESSVFARGLDFGFGLFVTSYQNPLGETGCREDVLPFLAWR